MTNGSFIFSSVVEFSSVTPSQCAQVCVEQLGTSCDGFYFCPLSTACYLTSKVSQSENVPGEPTVVVDTSSQASFCNYYKSKYSDKGYLFMLRSDKLIVSIQNRHGCHTAKYVYQQFRCFLL